MLVHLRGLTPKRPAERRAMRTLAWLFADAGRYRRAQRLARVLPARVAGAGPMKAWTAGPRPAGRSPAELPGVVA